MLIYRSLLLHISFIPPLIFSFNLSLWLLFCLTVFKVIIKNYYKQISTWKVLECTCISTCLFQASTGTLDFQMASTSTQNFVLKYKYQKQVLVLAPSLLYSPCILQCHQCLLTSQMNLSIWYPSIHILFSKNEYWLRKY